MHTPEGPKTWCKQICFNLHNYPDLKLGTSAPLVESLQVGQIKLLTQRRTHNEQKTSGSIYPQWRPVSTPPLWTSSLCFTPRHIVFARGTGPRLLQCSAVLETFSCHSKATKAKRMRMMLKIVKSLWRTWQVRCLWGQHTMKGMTTHKLSSKVPNISLPPQGPTAVCSSGAFAEHILLR